MIVWVLICFLTLLNAKASSMESAKNQGMASGISASEAGKGIFSQEGASGGFASFKRSGVTVNPNYQATTNSTQLKEQANQLFHTDPAAQLIQKSHQDREIIQIDLDHLEVDANGLLKNMGNTSLTADGRYEIRTCCTPGETFNRICKRQRTVVLHITPEKWESQTYCPGHERKERRGWSFHYSHWTEYCGGCATRSVLTQAKQVNVARDEWTGCEAEDKSHEEGLCGLIDERPGPYNETRMIQGESVQRDYWETTRVYKCGAKVSS